ncbi:MAG: carbamoyltransferase HypF [Dehalococcoidales bacterium]|nr:MAG: carbamoyltransferase HypF [Dehalococcoidales bacterium]
MKVNQSSPVKKAAGLNNGLRLRISVRGVVQGVGFRPFVYQLAHKHNLKGWVNNTSEGVEIDVEGEQADLDSFITGLKELAPPRSSIDSIETCEQPLTSYETFEIKESLYLEGKYQLVSPDIATCPACLEELFSSSNRRYLYPFTNCTNCGPRFTIIEDIPYDRPKTTMRDFIMCPQCQQEYDDPLNRRFHAQPNACPTCGPSLELVDSNGTPVLEGDALPMTSRLLREGMIVAIKGLGGFLIACDATSDKAVQLLRERKKRPSKPLAVMLATMEEVRKHCHVSDAEEELLNSPASPIVLLKWKAGSPITPTVAPQLGYLGVMLPYTPMHHVLCRDAGIPLVMTSGNISEEPIAKDNDEALQRLKGIVDYFLLHDRGIYTRYDDSVAMVAGNKRQLIRRARGYAPYPVRLPVNTGQVLACGAELKNTFCLTRDEHAFLSQHIGDMENLDDLEHFTATIELYKRLFRIQPETVACDMHPEYLSTRYARELASREKSLTLVPVQHHHAHIVSCMVDNGLQEPVIGVAFDGTGLGTDGHIWGGEFLLTDYEKFDRLEHFTYLPLPGGDAATRRPYRIAISYLLSLLGKDALEKPLPFLNQVDSLEIDLIKKQIERKINTPLTSSCGRLFDAVSALIGVRGVIDYEAQAAIELEMIADQSETGSYPFSIVERDGVGIIQLNELFSEIISDLGRGVSKGRISARFHRTVAQIIGQMCQHLSARTGISKVVLSGGVFQNRLLLELVLASLEEAGLVAFTHCEVPANDGGISLGQAVIASFTKERKN